MRLDDVVAEDRVREEDEDLYFGYWDEVAAAGARLDWEDRVTGRDLTHPPVELKAAA